MKAPLRRADRLSAGNWASSRFSSSDRVRSGAKTLAMRIPHLTGAGAAHLGHLLGHVPRLAAQHLADAVRGGGAAGDAQVDGQVRVLHQGGGVAVAAGEAAGAAVGAGQALADHGDALVHLHGHELGGHGQIGRASCRERV